MGVPLQVLRELHYFLKSHGVLYYEKTELEIFDELLKTLHKHCKTILFDYARKENVEATVKSLHYGKQVAVCDIGSGKHSILIHSYKDGVFEGFDPYWPYVTKNAGNNLHVDGFQTFPPYLQKTSGDVDIYTNLKVMDWNLFCKNNDRKYQMGEISMRFVTVLTKS
ncbi:hypothetical protein [Desulfosoma sp.]